MGLTAGLGCDAALASVASEGAWLLVVGRDGTTGTPS